MAALTTATEENATRMASHHASGTSSAQKQAMMT
jgi:hypothetical protein